MWWTDGLVREPFVNADVIGLGCVRIVGGIGDPEH